MLVTNVGKKLKKVKYTILKALEGLMPPVLNSGNFVISVMQNMGKNY